MKDKIRAVVIGDSCVDVFKYGECSRLCAEAPVAVFNPMYETKNIGMAGNVAANLRSLGADVELITNKEIVTKTRLIDNRSNQMLVRIDEADTVGHSFNIKDVDFKRFDVAIISDYNKGFLSAEDLEDISLLHPLTFLDTKKTLNQSFSNFDFIKINEAEWEKSQVAGNRKKDWASQLIVTLGEKGCVYDGKIFAPKEVSAVLDIAGAGDTFLAALVFKYIETADIEEAIIFANECAGKVIQRKGVSVI